MPAQSRQRTLDQERAGAAWEKVASVKRESFSGKYGSLARSAPVDIQSFGLGQTLGFWRAKGYDKGKEKDGGNEHARLLKDVGEWVSGQLKKQPDVAEEMKGLDLLTWITQKARADQYRRATVEAIAFLTWLKRFAEAELG